MATTEPRILGEEELGQIRRWAARTAADGGSEPVRRAARAVLRLADEARRARNGDAGDWDFGDGAAGAARRLTTHDLDQARRYGDGLAGSAESPELRAAARAIELLCADLEPRVVEDVDVAGDGGPPATRPTGGRASVNPLGALSLLAAIVLGLLLIVIMRAAAPDLDAAGPDGDALIGASDLATLELSIGGDRGLLDRATITVDGRDVTSRATRENGRLILRPRTLTDGEHVVRAKVGGVALWASSVREWHLTVDTEPPRLQFPSDVVTTPAGAPFVLRGTVAGAVELAVNGKAVALDGRGGFVVRADTPPGKLRLRATDAAGNTAVRTLTVELAPRLPTNPVRSAHVTAEAWKNDELRNGILALVAAGKINAVELDIKDESGVVGWDAPVPLARNIGAVSPIYDLAQAVDELHAKGVRVIGRLVVFRDPILARWAWKAKKRDMVIQTPAGKPYTGGYDAFASFTSFANPAVRSYNIDLAVAAAKLGVDDILYDYIRRPDGPLDTMVFPNLEGDPADSIVSFLADTRKALAPTKTFVGVSVFGIAVTRPDEVAQNVPDMARHVDYIAPLIYPSHWAPGEYGVDNPNAQPYDIVLRSMEDFKRAVRGTGARLMPWLQDFSLGVEYGPAEVKAQIDATNDAGVDEWILWDPAVTYTAAGLPAGAALPTTGEQPAATAFAPAPKLAPNELGDVPVLMFHQIRPDPQSEYDITPDDFHAVLERLYREGYRPVTASDLVAGRLDVPKGTTPVVLTFDDGTVSQAALREDGSIDPASAAGMLIEFAKGHPGFEPAATFYVNRDPFAAGDRTAALLQALLGQGFEIGNHTRDHLNLGELGPRQVQEQFVAQQRIIRELAPDATIETMALPFGVLPDRPGLAVKGTWDGESYRFKGVMLVGAEPAASPYSTSWDAAGIPRVRATLDSSLEYGFVYWFDRLAERPQLRYVSDGDPDRITVPADRRGEVAPAYAAAVRAR